MKVAIYEPEPRVCGPVAMVQPVIDGLRANRAQADFISFTKSGRARVSWGDERPGLRWWNTGVDRVEKVSNAAEVLREYDFVFLTEGRHISQDKAAIRDGGLPEYLQVLKDSGVPFTTMFFAPQYNGKLAPFLGELAALDNFAGFVMAQKKAFVGDAIRDIAHVVEMPFAYTPRHRVDDPVTYYDNITFAMGGRVVPNKGQQMLMRYADYAPLAGANIDIWGGSSVGIGPSSTLKMYEMMLEHGWEGNRVAAAPMKPEPYTLVKGDSTVRYLGNYSDPVETLSGYHIVPDITSHKYTEGLEFVTLEAMDAGCLPVVFEHLQSTFIDHRDLYDFIVINGMEAPQSITRLQRGEDLDVRFLNAMNTAIDHVIQGGMQETVKRNRVALRELHDPVKWAREMLVHT